MRLRLLWRRRQRGRNLHRCRDTKVAGRGRDGLFITTTGAGKWLKERSFGRLRKTGGCSPSGQRRRTARLHDLLSRDDYGIEADVVGLRAFGHRPPHAGMRDGIFTSSGTRGGRGLFILVKSRRRAASERLNQDGYSGGSRAVSGVCGMLDSNAVSAREGRLVVFVRRRKGKEASGCS